MQSKDPFDLIIAHGNCYDGLVAAWAATKHSPYAEVYFANYGEAPPPVKGKRVVIVDFSYPRDVLLKMAEECKELMVLDHHKTAEADLKDFPIGPPKVFIHFDMERSGAGMAWDELAYGPRPPIINFVEDRDLWTFQFASTKAFHAVMTTYPMDLVSVEKLSTMPVEMVVAQGKQILAYNQLLASKFASRAVRHWITNSKGDQTEVWAVNCPVEFVSDTAEVLKDRKPHLPILGWSFDGTQYYYSLRSRDAGPDVSEIAKTFGGGGHYNAAGFRLPYLIRPLMHGTLVTGK